MRKIVATTDVLAHDNRFPKGTGFVVAAQPNAGASPPEIDPTTAGAWLRLGWAKEDAQGKGKAGAYAG